MLIFAEGLVKLGVRVDLVVVKAEGPLSSIVPPEVNLVNLNKERMLHAIYSLWSYIRKERPSAIYSTIVHSNISAILATKFSFTGTRVIVRESNSPVSEIKKGLSRSLMHKLTPWVYPFADKVIAVSEGVASELRELNSRFGDKVSVLPTPVITTRFYDLAAKPCTHSWFSEQEKNVVLAAGRLVEQKDFDTLLDAFAVVSNEIPESRLVILGEGKLRPQLEKKIQDMRLGGRAALPGFVDNPLPYMKLARVFVLSSIHEGMPNVLVQALALGTPVVATDCKSGPRELLKDGAYGELVPVGDFKKLAAGIIKAWTGAVDEQALDYCKSTFSAEAAATNYLGLLEDVIQAA